MPCTSCRRGYLVLAEGLREEDKPGGEESNCYCPYCGKVAHRYPVKVYGNDYKTWTVADA